MTFSSGSSKDVRRDACQTVIACAPQGEELITLAPRGNRAAATNLGGVGEWINHRLTRQSSKRPVNLSTIRACDDHAGSNPAAPAKLRIL
jgi:hypothetical protein